MTNPAFHLGDILTLITLRACSPTGLTAVKKLCDHAMGRPLLMHEMPHALRATGDHLRAEFPTLAELTVPSLASPSDVADWLAVQVTRFGELHEVTPIRTADLVLASKES